VVNRASIPGLSTHKVGFALFLGKEIQIRSAVHMELKGLQYDGTIGDAEKRYGDRERRRWICEMAIRRGS
jgi:hypothetical protein